MGYNLHIGIKIVVIEIDFEDWQNMGKGRIKSDRERLDLDCGVGFVYRGEI